MPPAEAASPEAPILHARRRGQLSADAAFEQLYGLYGPVVLGWLAMRVRPEDADDLFQDVWTIFYGRWRQWQFLPEMDVPEARPVLSFLYRTCHFTLQGHQRRRTRAGGTLDNVEVSDGQHSPERLLRQRQLGQCLELARDLCPPEELDVLLAKLAGVPAREIARTLDTTEPVVDHRFRNAIARLQEKLQPKPRKGARKDNG